MAAINPYLTFDGNCEEAFKFYEQAFNTQITDWSRYGDIPQDSAQPAIDADKIMHVVLDIGQGTKIMGSDVPEQYGGEKFIRGTNFAISVNASSIAEADHIFAALSAGGEITMPLQDTFWGAYFGMWIDKFGIQWMINYDRPTSE